MGFGLTACTILYPLDSNKCSWRLLTIRPPLNVEYAMAYSKSNLYCSALAAQSTSTSFSDEKMLGPISSYTWSSGVNTAWYRMLERHVGDMRYTLSMLPSVRKRFTSPSARCDLPLPVEPINPIMQGKRLKYRDVMGGNGCKCDVRSGSTLRLMLVYYALHKIQSIGLPDAVFLKRAVELIVPTS